MKILMVCLGNICRSPLAEGVLEYLVEKYGLDWKVDSAGTSNWHEGEPPHHRSVKIAKNHGIDISTQRSRPFTAGDMEQFDHIYVMDSQNYQDVKGIAGKLWNPSKVDLILNASLPGKNKSVPDPWFENTDKAFEHVYSLLLDACEVLIKQLQQNN
ncbi:low molecular weight protein-tyrosine-phosphatase [Arachidicoccus terrestris]|uniref:low molecular weight protein-tyrosine-phosphatase n=1 Tax=Arachidicoccus terrestris TaxID=2875539 RepID=UPI001CC452A9|nr:low molecular weight protein-tyrosine-phosphatase [Arachidicoccus terrestris]UAY54912.1 low molecular weight phosphotyrosine protein phosphatase [Arachidicoccus terrestris]